MARASYRRRDDGILEIVRPGPWQRLGTSVRTCAIAALLLLAGSVGLFVHAQLAIPLVLVAGCCALALALQRSGRDRRSAAPARVPRATVTGAR